MSRLSTRDSSNLLPVCLWYFRISCCFLCSSGHSVTTCTEASAHPSAFRIKKGKCVEVLNHSVVHDHVKGNKSRELGEENVGNRAGNDVWQRADTYQSIYQNHLIDTIYKI